jgi:hypothetical protein
VYTTRLPRFVIAVAVIAFTAVTAIRAQQPAAADKFKNIQVLKMPADQLQPTMQYFTAALGVQCSFCHAPDGYEKDDRPAKKTARQMIQMVDRFNSGNNDITLTCATCHHGRQSPERTPPLAVEMTPAEATAAAARAAQRGQAPAGQTPPAGAPGAQGGRGQRPTETSDQIVDKYVQAMGGAAALHATSRIMHGTQTTRDLVTTPIVVTETAAGGYRIDVASTPPMVRAAINKTGWIQAFGNVHEIEGMQVAQVARLAEFSLPSTIKQRYPSLQVGRYGAIDGVDTISMSGRVDENLTEQLQFARQSGLLVRRTIQTRTPYGAMAEQIDYSDYRDVDGVKVPFQIRWATPSQVTTEKFTDVKLNTPVDASVFAKPGGPS